MPPLSSERVFDALADPTRRRIVERIAKAPATAGELAARLPITRQAVVKHLAILEAAGLAEGERDGRRVIYKLTPAPFVEATTWMHSVGAAWDRRVANLERSLKKKR
jgi:DNA-binding transcriptional ArsR family regulator